MYCKKCGMRQLSLDYNLCFYCACGNRHRWALYWEWHNGRYDKDDDPIGSINRYLLPLNQEKRPFYDKNDVPFHDDEFNTIRWGFRVYKKIPIPDKKRLDKNKKLC